MKKGKERERKKGEGKKEREEGKGETCWLEARAFIGGDLAAAPASFAKPRGSLES